MTSRRSRGGRTGLLGLIVVAAVAPALGQPPPPEPVRICAEWEPAVGTLIRWPLGIPSGLVVELARDDRLYVVLNNQQQQNQAVAAFTSWGVNMDHVEFIRTSVQTHWTRDWGPHQVFDGNGQWAIVDPIFQGYPSVPVECQPAQSPGGHQGDNVVNIELAAYFGAPLYSMPAYLTGGNFLVDGHRAGFSTCVMVGENQQLWTEAQFRDLVRQYVGVSDYHVVNNTENYGIQHIDCWMKVLDEETLLVKRPPTWHEEYTRIEQNLQALAAVQNAYGRPYRIIRIDCPPYDGNKIAAYTNSLILNKKVLVPLFGIPGDTQALQTFAQAMPGYQVIGFPGSWYYHDALHCRTRAIFDRYMLRIAHRRFDDQVPQTPQHELTARIDDRSEAGLIADELRVYWRRAGETDWHWELLAPAGEPDVYAGAIPGQPVGTTVEYYLAAADYSGRAETLPRTAPAGFYSFSVVYEGLNIAVAEPPALIPPWTLTNFAVTIDPGSEELVPGSARLHFRYDGGAYVTMPLAELGGNQWVARLPRALCDDSPEFYVSAEGSETGLKTAPPGAPASVFVAQVGRIEPVVVFSERLEQGLPSGWSKTGLWHVTGACAIDPPCDGNSWAYYGQDHSCDYNTGGRNSGVMTAPAVSLPAVPPGAGIMLSYCSYFETEDEPGYDVAGLLVNGVVRDVPAQTAAWQWRTVDLTAYAGGPVTLAWSFDTIDEYYNDYHGWQVDAVEITAGQIVCDFTLPYAPGDLNCDSQVDGFDIQPFVVALTDPAAYHAAHPDCTPRLADVNQDGLADGFDIQPFVGLLVGR